MDHLGMTMEGPEGHGELTYRAGHSMKRLPLPKKGRSLMGVPSHLGFEKPSKVLAVPRRDRLGS